MPMSVGQEMKKKKKRQKEDYTPKTQYLPITHFLVSTAPWFCILSCNASNTYLMDWWISFDVAFFCTRERKGSTNYRQTGAPYENQRKGEYESDFRGDVLLERKAKGKRRVRMGWSVSYVIIRSDVRECKRRSSQRSHQREAKRPRCFERGRADSADVRSCIKADFNLCGDPCSFLF